LRAVDRGVRLVEIDEEHAEVILSEIPADKRRDWRR
jgi:hypothetical protein